MNRTAFLAIAAAVAVGSAGPSSGARDEYFPLTAAPEYHESLLENDFVLVLDVSIPPGATVPAHRHPWPAVFVTLEEAPLVFRNLAGEVLREVRSSGGPLAKPKVEWRTPDPEPASVTNVGTNPQRALRIELKFLGP